MNITYTITAECKRLEDVPKGGVVIAVNDEPCTGICEECGKPLTGKIPHYSFHDGVDFCVGCSHHVPKDATHYANGTYWSAAPEYKRLDIWVPGMGWDGCWKIAAGMPDDLKQYDDYRELGQ